MVGGGLPLVHNLISIGAPVSYPATRPCRPDTVAAMYLNY